MSPGAGEGGGGTAAGELDCDVGATVSVDLGTGSFSFQPIDPAGVRLVAGPQGGFHVWISARTHGLGPRARARYGIRDAVSGEPVSRDGLQQIVTLSPGDGADEVLGLLCFVDGDALSRVGRSIVVWGSIEDACHPATRSEAATRLLPPAT